MVMFYYKSKWIHKKGEAVEGMDELHEGRYG